MTASTCVADNESVGLHASGRLWEVYNSVGGRTEWTQIHQHKKKHRRWLQLAELTVSVASFGVSHYGRAEFLQQHLFQAETSL